MTEQYDVIIVGAGPVGGAAANIAGRHGLKCLLVDETEEAFPLPRAVHFDADIMRIFQFTGLADRIEPTTRATAGGVHLGMDGEPIRDFRVTPKVGDYGWKSHYMFYQPDFDALLREAAAERKTVDTRFGWGCVGFEDEGDQVRVTLRETKTGEEEEVRGRYVIGADGAWSPIREKLGIKLKSYDFDEPWAVIDAYVPTPDLGPDYSIMYCDPERPGTYIPGPDRHRRWEFMLLPGESDTDFGSTESVADLISNVTDWVEIEDLDIIRIAVYRFHGLVADRWRDGRIFIIGDAAHQTPPFYGQGMCHGIRDGRNLLWKINEILAGRQPESLLDTFQPEREPHVRAVIEAAVANGRYICTLDPEMAAKRDEELRAKAAAGSDVRSFREVIPGLTAGILDSGSESDAVGLLFVQPEVTTDNGAVRLDNVLGDGYALLSNAPISPSEDLDWFREAGNRVLSLGTDVDDPSGLIYEWMSAFGCDAVLIRPDRYVFGVAKGPEVDGLVGRLRDKIDTVVVPNQS